MRAPLFSFVAGQVQLRQSDSRSVLASFSPGWRSRLPFFYGWVVVGSLFVAVTIGYGVYYSFSIFFVALLEGYGWSRASTAGVFSVFLATSRLTELWGLYVVVALAVAAASCCASSVFLWIAAPRKVRRAPSGG